MEQVFEWDERQLAVVQLSTYYLKNPRDKHSSEYLKTNPTRNLIILLKYIHHIFMEALPLPGDAFSILLPENFCKITWKDFMAWRLNNCKENQGHTFPSGYKGHTKPDSNPNAKHQQKLAYYTLLSVS